MHGLRDRYIKVDKAVRELNMREILVCITFREFDGSVNDKIQRRVLESFKAQTYQNFRLIVTNFKEKNVKKVLEEIKLPFEFHQSDLNGFHMSWTEVIQNSFPHIKKDKHIILWTNADNIFEPNFFSEVIKNFQTGHGGTSWPMLYYASLEDFEKGNTITNESMYEGSKILNNPYNSIIYKMIIKFVPKNTIYYFDAAEWVPDVIFLDGDLFLDTQNIKDFIEHKMDGAWQGMAQNLMLAFFSNNLINIVYKSKVHIIRNVRKRGGETWIENPKLFERQKINTEIMNKFVERRQIPIKFRPTSHSAKLNQHKQYKIVGSFYRKINFDIYLGFWTFYHYWKHFVVYGAGTTFLHKSWLEKYKAIRKYLQE